MHNGKPSDNGNAKPPYSAEAERSVLGAMLRDNSVIPDMLLLLRSEDFYADAHQKCFRAMTALHHKGRPVDAVTLGEQLHATKGLEDMGGYGYIAELWESVPTAANAWHYAHIVRDRSIVRRLISTGTEILRDAYNQNAPAEELVAVAEAKLLGIAEYGVSGDTLTVSKAALECLDEVDARAEGRSENGVLSGFEDLDKLTGGFLAGELVIIAARTSQGKTALALNIAANVAATRGVFFASLEQTAPELAGRLLCRTARVNTHFLRQPSTMPDGDRAKLLAALDELRELRMEIDPAAPQSLLRISSQARRLKKRYDLGAVFVDYLQLVEPSDRRVPRHEQIGTITRGLKQLAKELKVPVIALAQLVRIEEENEPQLHHLRESGSQEQDADTVLLLWKPPNSGPDELEVKVAKQRNGRTGPVRLAFIKPFALFENCFFNPFTGTK